MEQTEVLNRSLAGLYIDFSKSVNVLCNLFLSVEVEDLQISELVE